MTGADLQGVATQAVSDLTNYNAAAAVVVEDQAKLTTDQGSAQSAAVTAQASVKAAISAFSDALAAMPAVPQS